MPKLRWTFEGESGEIELSSSISFGRGEDNALPIGDGRLSRRHAVVEPDGSGGWKVVDQGSSNGLYSQGARMAEIPLVNGTEFQAGETRFRFEAVPSPVERTILMDPPSPATAATLPPMSAPAAGAPPAADVPSPEPPPRSRRGLAIAGVVVAIVIGLALVFSGGRKKAGVDGEEPGLFASEEEKEVARLRADLASRDYGTRWKAYETLKAKGMKPEPAPLWILDLQTHPDDDVREAAAEKLGKAKYTPAIPALRKAEKDDSDWNVRSAAEDALEEMGVE